MNRFKLENRLEVSRISIGADHFGTAIDRDTAFYILDAYTDMGGNFVDTANIYGKWVDGAGNASEKCLGEWLKSRKKDIVIATKGAHYNFDAPHIMRLSKAEIGADLDESLMALNKECVDLYWLHRDDTSREIGEILEALEDFKRDGKIFLYGASNFTAKRLFEAREYAIKHGITGFSAVSNQHSAATLNRGCNTNPDPTLVIHGENEERFHIETGTPLIPYQSTARGYFAKMSAGVSVSPQLIKAYDNEETRVTYKKVLELAEAKSCSVQAASLLYLMNAPYPILPITSVRNAKMLEEIRDLL